MTTRKLVLSATLLCLSSMTVAVGCGRFAAKADPSRFPKTVSAAGIAAAGSTCAQVGKTVQGFMPDTALDAILGGYLGTMKWSTADGLVHSQPYSLTLGLLQESGQSYLVEEFSSFGDTGNFQFSTCLIPGIEMEAGGNPTYSFVTPMNVLNGIGNTSPIAIEVILAVKSGKTFDLAHSQIHLRDCSSLSNPSFGCLSEKDYPTISMSTGFGKM
jgi:hypothetical protein